MEQGEMKARWREQSLSERRKKREREGKKENGRDSFARGQRERRTARKMERAIWIEETLQAAFFPASALKETEIRSPVLLQYGNSNLSLLVSKYARSKKNESPRYSSIASATGKRFRSMETRSTTYPLQNRENHSPI